MREKISGAAGLDPSHPRFVTLHGPTMNQAEESAPNAPFFAQSKGDRTLRADELSFAHLRYRLEDRPDHECVITPPRHLIDMPSVSTEEWIRVRPSAWGFGPDEWGWTRTDQDSPVGLQSNNNHGLEFALRWLSFSRPIAQIERLTPCPHDSSLSMKVQHRPRPCSGHRGPSSQLRHPAQSLRVSRHHCCMALEITKSSSATLEAPTGSGSTACGSRPEG